MLNLDLIREKIRELEEEKIPEAKQMKDDLLYIRLFTKLIVNEVGD